MLNHLSALDGNAPLRLLFANVLVNPTCFHEANAQQFNIRNLV
jgi:hypothetical protein